MLPSYRATAMEQVLPVKSSAPQISTMASPNGSPKTPATSFCSPGLLCAQHRFSTIQIVENSNVIFHCFTIS